jgi:protein-tyrosine kinase
MSSLIEKAALRLEQLRQAGVDMPADTSSRASHEAVAPVARAKRRNPAQDPIFAHEQAFQDATLRRPAPSAEPQSRQVQLDLNALMARGYVTPNAARTAIAEQFRVIKRPLIANATGKGAPLVADGNRIMVTSALPGEGRSFSALNLAMSIAMELDFHVLLVDADVARPSLMKVLGLPQGPGLLDLLVKPELPMSSAMLRTNVDKLSLLPSGTAHPRATELLSSEAMAHLLDEMGQRYPDRIIVFDSPPLLSTTESRVLASLMGQVVLVVQAGKTLESQVDQALASIEACPVKLLLLNQARGTEQNSYGQHTGTAGEARVAAPA